MDLISNSFISSSLKLSHLSIKLDKLPSSLFQYNDPSKATSLLNPTSNNKFNLVEAKASNNDGLVPPTS